MSMRNWIVAALAAVAGGTGCKWSEFDDIKDDAVVVSTEKPDNKATIWGVGLVPATRTASGAEAGVLGVFGASEPVYNEVVYAAAGGATIGDREVQLKDLTYATINVNPLTAYADDSDQIALVAVPTNEGVAFHGSREQLDATPLPGSMQPDAAAYVSIGGSSVLVVGDEEKLFTVPASGGATVCALQDDMGTPIHIRGIAGVGADTILVWADTGALYRYSNAVGTQCTGEVAVAPAPADATTATAPKSGSRILKLDAGAADTNAVLLVGVGETKGSLAVFAETAGVFAPVGAQTETENATSAALLRLPDARYVALGFPLASVDNVQAGQVRIYDVDATMGAGSVALVLNDSQPEDDQSYGRSVASLPYNGTEVLAVAADNEVFLYYRTELYDETRVRGQ